MNSRFLLSCAAVLGALGVGLGAFGSHALEGSLANAGLSEHEQIDRLQTWEVAVRYQFYHLLALLFVGLLARNTPTGSLNWVAALFLVGIIIFSGCLYVYVLTGISILGAIVPIGGTSLIAGWVVLLFAVNRMTEKSPG